MKQNETLNEISEMVLTRQLGRSIGALENFLLANPRLQGMDQLMAIRDDYQLMADYWQRGFDDPQREQVCDRLLRRMHVLVSDVHFMWQLSASPFMKAVHLRPRKVRKDWSMSAVRKGMETFVSDVALLALEPADSRQQKSDDLYRSHAELMHDLFDYILTSRQWRESLADAFLDMLLSPTLASIDQQLIVSAITLSAMQMFCMQKFRVLCQVYSRTTDEPLRQRALVGWVLAANAQAARLYTEMDEMVALLCDDEKTRQELAELQMQLLLCQDADADRDTIQNKILPNILSGNRLKVTGHGLEEIDDDTLEEMLHPEASEEAMERMEQSMQRMAEMQRQGADIYFGGFSQMKRFPFFQNDISNWMVPFYQQHPGISAEWRGTRAGRFLRAITRLGAFCDSDKYSLVLAFGKVVDHLPKNMVEMIEQGEATPMPVGGEVTPDEQREPAFMRRVYLQSLYRFFRLYPMRSEFADPFAHPLFFGSTLFARASMAGQATAVARFLMKRRRYAYAADVLAAIPEAERTSQHYIMLGTALQHHPARTATLSPLQCFRRALDLQPTAERAQAGLARALFGNQQYDEAFDTYKRLMESQPDNAAYQQGAAVCLLNMGRAEEAQKLLFRLNYEHPDDTHTTRALAWALTVDGKYQQAEKFYQQLLAADQPLPADMLNYGLCLWMAHSLITAIGMFRQFQDSKTDGDQNLETEFTVNSRQLLADHGITDTEIQLMLDACI